MTTSDISVPNYELLHFVEELCEIEEPYARDSAKEQLFVKAMKQIFDWHCSGNEFYGKLATLKNFRADMITDVHACNSIPFVLANYFKLHEELSVPKEQIEVHLTSSGTTGQKSQIFFDSWTLGSAQRMIDFIFKRNSWVSVQPTNYLLYSYETEAGSKLGTSYTDNFLCKYAPVNSSFTALRLSGDGKHEFDVFGAIEALRRFEREGLPVRIFGFPSFLHFTLERMRQLKIPNLNLSKESFVFLGGGWKGHADKAIDKVQLYKYVSDQLGIPDERIRDSFGSVEHCIPYVECSHHQFHVPVWSRVFIRDVASLEPLPFGQKGFLHFVAPYITSVPAASVLMGDLASLHDGRDCPCEIESEFFVIHGRAGLSRNKSCAVAAAELLSAGKV